MHKASLRCILLTYTVSTANQAIQNFNFNIYIYSIAGIYTSIS